MNKYTNKLRIFCLIALCVWSAVGFTLLSATTAHAQSNTLPGQALEIAPPVIYVDAKKSQSIKKQIFLRNISSGDLIVTGEANDFVASGEDGTPKLLLGEEADNNPYSLKSWIQPPASLRLVPKEIKTMNITINVPSDASPGGHYGIIRFTATPPSLKDSGVSLSTSLGALILVTVAGKAQENLSVEEFSVSRNGQKGTLFESGPLVFTQRIKNTGNVHEQPAGQVTITDMFGKKVATLNVNLPPRNILPESVRKFEQPLDKAVIGDKRLFGKYTATLNITYGKDKKTVSSTLTFWVIPYKLIALIIVILIAGFFGIRYSFKRYNRYIIKRSSKSRRK